MMEREAEKEIGKSGRSFFVTNIIAVNLTIKSMSGSTMTQISEKAVSGELGIEVDILEMKVRS